MSAQPDDSMERLYEQFRSDLAANVSDVYYDEADLIDVFDYAGDVHDDYVRTEALALASRLFPNSDDFAKRKAIFLANLNEEAFRSFMLNRSVDTTDPIWAILKCRAENPSGEEATEILRKIAGLRLEEDEEIIQYVALVKYLRQEQWLAENLDFLRKQSAYEQTLMFEIARLADTKPQCSLAIKILEELTMMEPFNVNYWGLLAELQANAGKFADALLSIDYAKSITPDDSEMLAMEGYVHLRNNRPEAATASLEHALRVDPDIYIAKRNLLQAYKLTEQTDKYLSLLAEVYELSPFDPAILMEYICNFPEQIPEAMARFYTDNEPDESQICQLAGEMCNNSNRHAALEMLIWFKDNYGLSQSGSFTLIELYYVNHRYEEAYTYFSESVSDSAVKPQELPIIGILASLMLKLHLYDYTREFCRIWLKHLDHPDVSISANKLTMRGLKATLQGILDLVSKEEPPTSKEILSATL